MPKPRRDLTTVLRDYQEGNASALEELIPLVYHQLRHIAQKQILPSNREKTITPTALVNELFIVLKTRAPLVVENRAVFFMAAARCMRRLLIDYARRKQASKRGGEAVRVTLDERVHGVPTPDSDIERLNDALARLTEIDPELSQIVELRYLVGLEINEVSEVLHISPMTVKRRWNTAKAWLKREVSQS